MTDLMPKTIQEAAAGLRSGEMTSVGLTTAILKRVEALNETLGAYVTVTADGALAAAEAADQAFEEGRDVGPLQGIPLAVKDIIATKDAPTTANSRVLDPDWGLGVDAPVVERLRHVGAVLLGKTTTSEFACGLPDPTKGFLVPHNPWNLEHSASGSSAGTGIAVAAGLALGGLGTDTGGSVRAPAAANGHTGLKVTFGRVPKSGVVPLGYTLDSVGPMARSAYDCALLLEVMSGYDAGDPYSSKTPVPPYATFLTGDLAGLRVGVPQGYFLGDEVGDDVRGALEDASARLAEAGAVVSDVNVPLAAEAGVATNITWLGEGFAYHRNDLVRRWSDYGASTRDVLGRGAFFTGADYNQAQRVRRAFRQAMIELFSRVDLLLTPAAAGPAGRSADMDMGRLFTTPGYMGQWNLLGAPAIAFPCGFSASGLPLSLQIVGKPFDEATVLKATDTYQRSTEWHLRVPPLAEAI
jgi:aspartyl-tRNA(Asn)/glutamyl-tRNA(Gln) amidotransferase subunit A